MDKRIPHKVLGITLALTLAFSFWHCCLSMGARSSKAASGQHSCCLAQTKAPADSKTNLRITQNTHLCHCVKDFAQVSLPSSESDPIRLMLGFHFLSAGFDPSLKSSQNALVSSYSERKDESPGPIPKYLQFSVIRI